MTDLEVGDILLAFPPEMGQPMKQTIVGEQGGKLVVSQDFLTESEYRLLMGPIMTIKDIGIGEMYEA